MRFAAKRSRSGWTVRSSVATMDQDQVGPGFKEMFTGVGHTVVEGAKFSGENIKEFFAGKK